MNRLLSIAGGALTFSAFLSASTSTTTTLVLSPVAPAFGQKVTMVATVSPAPAPGFVSFLMDGGILVGSAAVNLGGFAQATTLTLPAGTHTFVASYGGFAGGGDLASKSLPQAYTVKAGADTGFAAAVNYGLGTSPIYAAIGDFNGDGVADVVASNYGGNVSVLLGNGNGTFQTAVAYAAGVEPYFVATGDFNGDGISDLAVADYGGNTVAVLIGSGGGAFNPAVTYPAGVHPASIAIADFNGDGKADLAVADSTAGPGTGPINIFLGNGDGTFQAAVPYSGGVTPGCVAAGDFNGDGKTDLVVANFGGANVSVLIGNGDGTFQAAANYPAGTGADFVVVADFNGDGRADLAVTNDADNDVSILIGNGNGTFQAPVNYATSINPISVALGDFNGDGNNDLVIADHTTSNVSVLLSNGNGTFQAAVYYAAGTGPDSILTGDFNGDGIADIAVANSVDGNLSVLLGGGGSSLAAEPVSVVPAAGSGSSQTFSFTYTDPAGFADLKILDVLTSTFLDGQTACYFAFLPSSSSAGTVYLVDDAGDAGGPFAGALLVNGSSGGSINNSQCTLSGSGSSVSASGNTLTLNLVMTFSSGWAGNKAFYMAARTATQNSGWQALGTWDVAGSLPAGPGVGVTTPARSVSMGQTYTFTFTDTAGYSDLFVLDVLTGSFLDGTGACYFAYVPTTVSNGYLYLVDDAGDGGYAPGSPIALSSGSTLSNSQCTLSTTGSSASASGNTLTLNLPIAFTSAFAGNQVFFEAARNTSSGNSGWQAAGSVTVP